MGSVLELNSIEDSNVLWARFPGDDVAVLSGGVKVEGWRQLPNGLWESPPVPRPATFSTGPPHYAAAADGYAAEQLWVADIRASLVRLPAAVNASTSSAPSLEGYFNYDYIFSPANSARNALGIRYTVPEGSAGDPLLDPARWSRPGDVTALVFSAPWAGNPRRLSTVTNQSLLFATPLPGIGTMSTVTLGGRRWIALNVKEALTAERRGEFYYDTQTSRLQYARRVEESAAVPLVGMLPRLPTLVSISEASNVTLASIQFSYTSMGPNPANVSYRPAAHAAVEVSGSNIAIVDCVFKHIGGNGLQTMPAAGGARNLTVSGSLFIDIGSRGFSSDEHWEGSAQPVAVSQDVLVRDCVFQGCGRVFLIQPYCVYLGGKRNISIEHCDISDVPYSGIRALGSRVHEAEPLFRIEANHLHRFGSAFSPTHYGLTGTLLSDFGGIFVTTHPGFHGDCAEGNNEGHPQACAADANVHNNVVHNGRYFQHGCVGLYADQAVSHVNFSSNLVFDIGSAGLELHCGSADTVTGNIFAGNAVQDATCSTGPPLQQRGGCPHRGSAGKGAKGFFDPWASSYLLPYNSNSEIWRSPTDFTIVLTPLAPLTLRAGPRSARQSALSLVHTGGGRRPGPVLRLWFAPAQLSRVRLLRQYCDG